MDQLLNPPNEVHRALAIRMARVHTPEHHIAFMLGFTPQKLRTLYAHDMQHAVIAADLEIRETLWSLAKSGKNTAATIFWFKTYSSGTADSSGRAEKKSSETKSPPKRIFRTDIPPPGTIRFIGPNGEIVT